MKPSSEAIRKWVSLGGSLAVVSAAASVEPLANPSTSATIEESNAKPIDIKSKTRTEIPETTTATTDNRDPEFGEGIQNPESVSDELPSSHLINANVDASFSEKRPRLSLERCHPDLGVLACTQPGESCVAVVSGDDAARGDATANAMRALSSESDGDGFGWYCLPHHGEDADADDVSSADHYHRALQTPTVTVLTPSSFAVVPAPGGANEIYDFCKQAFTYDGTSDPQNNDPSSYDVCICQGYDNNLPDPKYANYCERDIMVGYCNKYHPKDPSNTTPGNKLPYDSCICTLTDDHPSEDDPAFCSTFPALYCGYKDAADIQSCSCDLFLEGCGTALPTTSSSSASSPFESFVEPSTVPSEAPVLSTDAPTTTAPVPAPTDAPTNEPVPVPTDDAPPDGDGDGDAAEPTGEAPGVDASPTDGDGDGGAAPTEAPVPLGGFQATNMRQPTVGTPSPLHPSSGKHSSSASAPVSVSVSLAVTTAVAACAVGSALGAFVA